MRNFQITLPRGGYLGASHIRPTKGNIDIQEQSWDKDPIDHLRFDWYNLGQRKSYFYSTIKFTSFHGNAGNRATSHRIAFYKLLTGLQLDSNVIAIDYRGFGNSSSLVPTEQTLQQDAKSAFDWIISQGVNPKNIVIVGHSLGSGIAIDLAYNLDKNNQDCGGLVILSGYASIGDAAIGYPMVPILRPFHGYSLTESIMKSLIRDKWTSYSKIKEIQSVPILLLHGKSDIEINIWQAKALFISAVEGRTGQELLGPKRFWELRTLNTDKPKSLKTRRIGIDGELWHFDSKKGNIPLWFLLVTHAGHNTLAQHQIVQDTLNSWTSLWKIKNK